MSFDGNIEKQIISIATSFENESSEYKKIEELFANRGAIVKDVIGKNTQYLFVDTENIEKLRCFVHRSQKCLRNLAEKG